MKEEKYINGRNGPKPLGDEPMTPAERKRRSRLKLKQDGGKEYQVKINKKQLQAIKHYSKLKQTKTNQTIKTLLQEALEHISDVMAEVEKMNDDDGKTHNDMIMYINTYLFPNLTKNNYSNSSAFYRSMYVRTQLQYGLEDFLHSLKRRMDSRVRVLRSCR